MVLRQGALWPKLTHSVRYRSAVWGSPRYWPFWWHVQGPDEGKSTWNLAQQAKPALARAILVDGEVPAPPPQTQQMGSQSRDAADDEDGEVVATCQKNLRVEDLVDAMSYRLLRNGIRLEEVSSSPAQVCGHAVRAPDAHQTRLRSTPLPTFRCRTHRRLQLTFIHVSLPLRHDLCSDANTPRLLPPSSRCRRQRRSCGFRPALSTLSPRRQTARRHSVLIMLVDLPSNAYAQPCGPSP